MLAQRESRLGVVRMAPLVSTTLGPRSCSVHNPGASLRIRADVGSLVQKPLPRPERADESTEPLTVQDARGLRLALSFVESSVRPFDDASLYAAGHRLASSGFVVERATALAPFRRLSAVCTIRPVSSSAWLTISRSHSHLPLGSSRLSPVVRIATMRRSDFFSTRIQASLEPLPPSTLPASVDPKRSSAWA